MNLKNIAIFVAGLTIGGLTATVVMKRMYDDLEAEFNEYLDATQSPGNKCEGDIGADEAVTTRDDIKRERESKRNAARQERRDYSNMVNNLGYSVEGEADPAELEHPQEEDSKDYQKWEQLSDNANQHYNDNVEPYVISIEQFSEENDHYDKSTIYFYEDDETLADENEEIIQDILSVIGGSALSSFGCGSGDREIVYVRNDKMEIDYEVIRLSKSYSETVLGRVKGRGLDG